MIDLTNYSPPPRKPDLLDELNVLRSLRAQAYFANDSAALETAHQELKQFWLRNGWSEEEAQEAYEEAVKESERPLNLHRCNHPTLYMSLRQLLWMAYPIETWVMLFQYFNLTTVSKKTSKYEDVTSFNKFVRNKHLVSIFDSTR